MKLRVTLLVGLGIFGLGITLLIVGALASDFNLNFDNVEYNEVILDSDGIDTLDIDVDADSIIIKKSEDDKIRINSKTSNEMDYIETVSGNVLKITQDFEEKFFHISLGLGFFNDKAYEIALPDNILYKLNVVIDAGNLNITDINISECDIELDAGNVTINNSNISDANIVVNAGNARIESEEIDSIYMEVDAGNIKLKSEITTRGDFDVNCGNLSLDLIGSSSDYCVNSNDSTKAVITYDVDFGNDDISYVN